MIIRSAKIEDLTQVEKMLSVPEFRFPDGEFPFFDFLKIYLDEDFFLVAEDDGKLIGAIFGEPLKGGLGAVWYFVVDDSCRGKGVGGDLYNEFEKRVKNRGVEWILAYVNDNEKAVNFYKKNGYNTGHKFVEMNKEII